MIVPRSIEANGSSFIASRMRCIMCHAVSGVISCIRAISRAEMPFFAEAT